MSDRVTEIYFSAKWPIEVGDYIMFSVDKTLHENAVKIALNSTCIKEFELYVLSYDYLALV